MALTLISVTTSDKSPVVSIIIPAYNEEECITVTLQAIRDFPPHNHYEVLVIDNGSTDRTSVLVEMAGVRLISHPEGTIASVRNRGVAEACGEILVFLDADVLVTAQWADSMMSVIAILIEQPLLVTGSRCLPFNDGNWFNRYWFARLAEYEAPYINSGHLITSRKLFDQIQGFSEHLKTAEDYDFCMKAKATGAELINNPDLPVIHTGYPRTLAAFIRRERWHGREDFETWVSFFESKVGWAAAFNLILLLLVAGYSVMTMSLWPVLLFFIVMFIVSLLLTLYKFRAIKLAGLIQTTTVFFIYLCGRSLAIVDRLLGRQFFG